jgi:hypothetical protein
MDSQPSSVVFSLTIPRQLTNLKARTGAECLFFACCGTTDLALRSISFSTERLENFLPLVLNIDEQDFVGKLEGFALQSLNGMAGSFEKLNWF